MQVVIGVGSSNSMFSDLLLESFMKNCGILVGRGKIGCS